MIRISIVLVAVVVLSVGCSRSHEGDRAGRSANDESSAKEIRMTDSKRTVTIKTSDDLLALRSLYMNLWSEGFDGTLEVEFASGTYGPVNWSLAPDPNDRKSRNPRIDVVLRGSAPTVLSGLPTTIVARNLSLSDLILTGMRSAPVIWQVSGKLVMQRSMVIDSRFGDPNFQGAYIEVRAQSAGKLRKQPVQVLIEDSWFVRDFQSTAPMTMLSLASAADNPAHYSDVTIRRSAFLGNAYATEVMIDFAKRVHIVESVFYKTWPAGKLLHCKSSAEVLISDSLFVVEDMDHIASTDHCPALRFEGSRISAKSWQPGAAIPKELAIDPSQLVARTGLAGEDVLAEAAKIPADRMPTDELRKQLDALVRSQH
jgi:hypothetical protein